MLYLSFVLAGVLGLTTLAWAGLLRGLIRQHARERDLLLNQLMHLAGRTWAPPPSTDPRSELPDLDYTFTPEQDEPVL